MFFLFCRCFFSFSFVLPLVCCAANITQSLRAGRAHAITPTSISFQPLDIAKLYPPKRIELAVFQDPANQISLRISPDERNDAATASLFYNVSYYSLNRGIGAEAWFDNAVAGITCTVSVKTCDSNALCSSDREESYSKTLGGYTSFSTQISYTKKRKNLYQDYYTAGVHSDIKTENWYYDSAGSSAEYIGCTERNNKILNPGLNRRSYSSSYDSNHKNSLLDGHFAWSVGSNNKHKTNNWAQIDNGKLIHINGIVTQMRSNSNQRVKTLKVQVSDDGNNFENVDNGKIFDANIQKDFTKKITIIFSKTYIARSKRRLVDNNVLCNADDDPKNFEYLFKKGSYGDLNVGKAVFDKKSLESTCSKDGVGVILKRECSGCGNDHKLIFYKRKKVFGDTSMYDILLDTWRSSNNEINNHFELYSTLEDALKGTKL